MKEHSWKLRLYLPKSRTHHKSLVALITLDPPTPKGFYTNNYIVGGFGLYFGSSV
jgi:hypothetical protein